MGGRVGLGTKRAVKQPFLAHLESPWCIAGPPSPLGGGAGRPSSVDWCRIAKERRLWGGRDMIRSIRRFDRLTHYQTLNALEPQAVLLTAWVCIKSPLVGHVGKQGWQKGFKLVLG
jgi:hypothetical protein